MPGNLRGIAVRQIHDPQLTPGSVGIEEIALDPKSRQGGRFAVESAAELAWDTHIGWEAKPRDFRASSG